MNGWKSDVAFEINNTKLLWIQMNNNQQINNKKRLIIKKTNETGRKKKYSTLSKDFKSFDYRDMLN